jgi:hypothetical protein
MKPINTLLQHLVLATGTIVSSVHAAEESSVMSGGNVMGFMCQEFKIPFDLLDTQYPLFFNH